MRTIARRKQTIATPLQKISSIPVKWTSLFLILLVIMVTTCSGRFLPITRANPSHKNSAAIPPGCPPPDSASAEVFMDPMGDACFYYKTPGCTGNYNLSSGNYCYAEVNPSSFPAAGSQCPSAAGAKMTPDGKTCFILAPQGYPSCGGSYPMYIIPDCTPAFNQPGTVASHPDQVYPGCPQAPPGVDNSLIYVNHIQDKCYYDITLSGGSCAGAYTQQSGSYCAADNSQFSKAGDTSQCLPAPSGQTLQVGGDAGKTCFYFASQGFSSCGGSYPIYEVPDCTPPPGSQGNSGSNEGYPEGSSGQIPSCTVNKQLEGFDVAPTASSNATFKTLTDVSCNACAAGGDEPSYEESGGTAVTCVFDTGKMLICNNGSGGNSCYVENDGQTIGRYTCGSTCEYHDSKGDTIASSNCGNNSSCTITTCIDTSNATTVFEVCPNPLPSPLPPTLMQVNINQQCTPSAPQIGQPLTCKYSNDGNNAPSDKVETFSRQCSGQNTSAQCTNKGPYNQQIGFTCTPTDNTFQCPIQDTGAGNTPLRTDKACPPNSTTPPSCQIVDSSNKSLGNVNCSGGNPASCTIKDTASDTMTISCDNTNTCRYQTPDCPRMWTGQAPPLKATGAATTPNLPVPEMACNGSLLVDEVSMAAGSSPTTVTLQYPLSQAELVYLLQTLGIGSQAWTFQTTGNVPPVTALAGGLSGG